MSPSPDGCYDDLLSVDHRIICREHIILPGFLLETVAVALPTRTQAVKDSENVFLKCRLVLYSALMVKKKVSSGLRDHASASSGCIGKFTQPRALLFYQPCN